jgi:hypothetical protein
LAFLLLQKKGKVKLEGIVNMIHLVILGYVARPLREYLFVGTLQVEQPIRIATAFIILKNDFCSNKLNSKNMTRKKLKWAVLPVTLALAFIGFSSFTEEGEAGGEAYCKNDPSKNTGVCIKSTSGVFDCPTLQGTTTKDCYGVVNP